MSSETGTVGSDLPDAYYRHLFSLVPAHSLKSIINELAVVWLKATNVDAAYIAVIEPKIPRLVASIYQTSLSGPEYFVDGTVHIVNEIPISEQLPSILEQGRDFKQISCKLTSHFSIFSQHDASAGVCLFSSTRFTEDQPLILQLINISQRLLSQVLKYQVEGQTESGFAESGQARVGEQVSSRQMVLPSKDKLEAMAEFAAGAGHEINNPIATIVGRVQMLLKGETDPQRRQSLTTIGGQAYRVRDMIGDAMLFARPPAPQPVVLPLQKTTEEVLNSLQENISASQVHVSVEMLDTDFIWADEVQWKVVLSNLILNSLNVLQSGGKIEILAEEKTTSPIRIMHIRIIDDGPGLTAQEREHLFDPFFSARQAGRGLGFGLSKCWRIITLHGGTIEAEINADKGMTFHLFWPIRNFEESKSD